MPKTKLTIALLQSEAKKFAAIGIKMGTELFFIVFANF